MDMWIENGDYVPDGKGGFVMAEGIDAVVQRVIYRLSVPQGSFLPQPEFGSLLSTLCREKPSSWEALAGQYVRLAVEEEEDVTLDRVSLSPLTGGKVELTVYLLWQGDTVSFSLTLIE